MAPPPPPPLLLLLPSSSFSLAWLSGGVASKRAPSLRLCSLPARALAMDSLSLSPSREDTSLCSCQVVSEKVHFQVLASSAERLELLLKWRPATFAPSSLTSPPGAHPSHSCSALFARLLFERQAHARIEWPNEWRAEQPFERPHSKIAPCRTDRGGIPGGRQRVFPPLGCIRRCDRRCCELPATGRRGRGSRYCCR